MELFLNILWAAFAIACLMQWLRVEQRERRNRKTTFVAWVMLVVILFPVISVSDDLWAIQNPAEADSFARRDPHASTPQSVHHGAAGLPEIAQAEYFCGPQRSQNVVFRSEPSVDSLCCEATRNRPPPTA